MFTLICGLPNAGKTTYSQRFENVLHLDDFPKSKFLNCNEAVKNSTGDIVVEGIYNIRCRREKLLEAAGNRKKVCIFLDVPVEECIRRENHDRMRGEGVVKIGASMLQPPTLDEGWDEIIIFRGNEECPLKLKAQQSK